MHVSKKIVNSNLMGLRIIMQSNSKSAHFLDGRSETWLKSYRDEFSAMSDEEFAGHIKAVKERFHEQPKNLDNESEEVWSEIVCGTYVFNRRKILAKELDSITLEE